MDKLLDDANIFDTLRFSKRAQAVGFTKEQAEFQAQEFSNIIETKLATKNDLILLEKNLLIKMGLMLTGIIGLILSVFKLVFSY